AGATETAETASIRDLENAARCEEAISGEVHADSLPFSAALWAARQSRPTSERLAFDRGIVAGLLAAPSGDLDFSSLPELLRGGLKSVAGDDAAAALAAAF